MRGYMPRLFRLVTISFQSRLAVFRKLKKDYTQIFLENYNFVQGHFPFLQEQIN